MRARVPPDLDPEGWNDYLLRELERGVGVSLEGAGGNRIRVGEIPELPDAENSWAHGLGPVQYQKLRKGESNK